MSKNIFKSFRQDAVIFIDGANLFYCQKELKIKIDYQKLYDFLYQYKRIIEIRIYLAFDHQSKKEKQFIENLQKIGYKVICKKLKIINIKNKTIVKKGNLDIELALDAFELQKKYRTIVLFSGDSDFEILFKKLRKKAKRCLVFSARKHISHELMKISHQYFFLDKIKKYIKKIP